MDIGREQAPIVIEPIEAPVPVSPPAPVPTPPEPVPAAPPPAKEPVPA